jgi:hypothetical protein
MWARKPHAGDLSNGRISEPRKMLEGYERSRSPRKSQKPCGETLVTSTGEVPFPSIPDFTEVFLDQSLYRGDLLRFGAEVDRQLHGRLDPEARVAQPPGSCRAAFSA